MGAHHFIVAGTIVAASIGLPAGKASASAVPAARTSHAVRALAQDEARRFEELRREGFAGAVVLIHDGKPLFRAASGMANAGAPFTADTKIDIASISKPITSMAIFRLIESGKVDLDDTLGRWFPEAPADKRGITIRQMMTNSSGLVDIPPGMSDYRPTTAAEMARRIFAEPLDFPPGTDNNYSNSGFNLLGMIVEKASGETLFDFLEREIFRKAHVKASYDPQAFPESEVADGAHDEVGTQSVRQFAAVRNGPFWGLWGAGGIFISASDLAKLFEAYRSGQVVSPSSVKAMTSDGVPAGSYASEALGWTLIHTSRGTDFVSYTGGSAHSNTALRFYPERKLTVVAVATSQSPGAVRVARTLAEPVVGPDFTPNTVPAGLPKLTAAKVEDVQAIKDFMAAVGSPEAAARDYLRARFEPFASPTKETEFLSRMQNLASIGRPKIVSIFHRDNDSVLIFETIESEYPRLYELALKRSGPAKRLNDYKVKRVQQ